MAVTAYWYGAALEAAWAGDIDFVNDTIKLALVANTYTPDQDAHDYWDDVSAHEISGSGYTAGGQALANKTAAYTGATNVFALGSDPATWSGATFTARYAVLYKDTGVAATSPLIGWIDFGVDESPAGETFIVTPDASGWFKVTLD